MKLTHLLTTHEVILCTMDPIEMWMDMTMGIVILVFNVDDTLMTLNDEVGVSISKAYLY